MSEVQSATKEIVKRLAEHLKNEMPELVEVLEDWPESNMALSYPSLSIFSGPASEHRHYQPRILSQEDILSAPANRIATKWIVGDYEWRLQLDMWCGSKPERARLYERFYQAFNSQFVQDEMETMGISLRLVDYHNIIARYDLSSYVFDDSESATQRKEWRTKIVVVANCHAILDKEQYKVVETQVVSDIRTDILVINEEGA